MAEQVWRRGDVVDRQNDFGLVVADMDDHDDHLIVRWLRGVEVEEIHRSKIGDIRKFTDSEINALGFSPLERLKKLEAWDTICAATAERSRMMKTVREMRSVDDLIARTCGNPQCKWDEKNAASLFALALKPDEVGWGFKIRERIHRPISWLFHRRRAPPAQRPPR